MEEKIDIIAVQIAKKYGYDNVPWFKLTWYVLWAYTFLTVLVMFCRPDFINMTVCICAIFMMFNTNTITKGKFRALVLGIVFTLVVDIFWFIMNHS
jgi:cell division protein FtsW (lipid II flippase)